MAHIELGVDERQFPGLAGLIRFRPDTGKAISDLADILLRGPHSMTAGDRELIGTYVSRLNECTFCASSHAAVAAAQLDEGMPLVEQVLRDPDTAEVSPKLRALLRIAGAVQESGRKVTGELVHAARAEGASDLEIHDTVLIAASFCMVNRYVDGLDTFVYEDPDIYAQAAEGIIAVGYSSRLVPAADQEQ
jgi:uncharacterized peroxidase-related enzyme